MNRKEKNAYQELPYERFLRFGPESMSEAELLAVIIIMIFSAIFVFQHNQLNNR